MKEFDYGDVKRDMRISVQVSREGYLHLWWKKGGIEIKMYPLSFFDDDTSIPLRATTCDHPIYNYCDNIPELQKSSGWILRQCKEKLDSKITSGKRLQYENDQGISMCYYFEFSSLWDKEKMIEAIDYFVNSVVKWKV